MIASHTDSQHSMEPDYAAVFADFSSALSVDSMPPAVIQAAKTNIFDTLACATAGLSAQGVKDLVGLVTDWGGKPEAAIWCTGQRVPAHHAAWVNGMMSHARDYDDTHDRAVLHGGVSVVPAAIAAAELNPAATGADLIAGVAAGLEFICRLGVAARIGPVEIGFLYTSLFGHFAATVAAARVAGLNAEQTVNAIGIAYSQAAGTHQVTRDAALTKRIQPGFAAKTALISVAMTRIGIRGAQRTFDGVDGFLRTYLRNEVDSVALRAGLGSEFEFVNLSYKPYPCCRYNHTAIDAALAVREKLGPNPNIKRVIVRMAQQAYEAVCTPPAIRKNPQTVVQAQFSVPFTVACALVKGRIGLEDFTDEGIRNPDVLALAARVEPVVDAEIERLWARSIPPTVLVVETDGGSFKSRVDYPLGGTQRPMSRADFDSKLANCLRISGNAWPADTANRLRTAVDTLETSKRAVSVIEPLVQSRKA